jgi:hypothetical protein
MLRARRIFKAFAINLLLHFASPGTVGQDVQYYVRDEPFPPCAPAVYGVGGPRALAGAGLQCPESRNPMDEVR